MFPCSRRDRRYDSLLRKCRVSIANGEDLPFRKRTFSFRSNSFHVVSLTSFHHLLADQVRQPHPRRTRRASLNIYLITRIRMKGARRQNEGEGGEGAHEARVGRLLARRGRRGRRREGSLSLIIRNSIDCPTVVPPRLPPWTVSRVSWGDARPPAGVLSYGRMYLPFGQRRICICAGTLSVTHRRMIHRTSA